MALKAVVIAQSAFAKVTVQLISGITRLLSETVFQLANFSAARTSNMDEQSCLSIILGLQQPALDEHHHIPPRSHLLGSPPPKLRSLNIVCGCVVRYPRFEPVLAKALL